MEKMSWRETILRHLHDEGEVSAESLHEAAEGEDDLQAATDALDLLVKEDIVYDVGGMTYAVRVGAEARVRAEIGASRG